ANSGEISASGRETPLHGYRDLTRSDRRFSRRGTRSGRLPPERRALVVVKLVKLRPQDRPAPIRRRRAPSSRPNGNREFFFPQKMRVRKRFHMNFFDSEPFRLSAMP